MVFPENITSPSDAKAILETADAILTAVYDNCLLLCMQPIWHFYPFNVW